MTRTVHVHLGHRSYEIHIGEGLIDHVGSICSKAVSSKKALIVSDDVVAPLYASRLETSLNAAGIEHALFTIPSGESSKAEAGLFAGYNAALDAGLDRHSFVIALGGGVVGDLAGYLAASYLRGIPFIQVPTTLLAMVDSSVGGKTGINLPKGKNLIGAFHQPASVIADLRTLETLPVRELHAGMAEVIKYGVIRDEELFDAVEDYAETNQSLDMENLSDLVERSCRIKAEVVEADEREGGLRSILNFGHTLGHALEQVSGYSTYLHGEAIAVGMHAAARISEKVQGLAAEDRERLVRLLQAFDLPIQAADVSWEDLMKAMERDKKSVAREPRFVLASAIGEVEFGIPVEASILKEAWDGCSQ